MNSLIRAKLSGVLVSLTLLALLPLAVHPQASLSLKTPPVVIGWSGSRLLESNVFHQSNSASEVFPTENASDMEMQARLVVQKGSNAYRASFAPYCTDPKGFFGTYNASQLHRSIEIAAYYGLWIIVDYHGYNDLRTNSTTTCWLTFWQNVVQQFSSSYDRIIWEPLNEPNATIASIAMLSSDYQEWVNQARSLGDNHWIVIENLCSFRCDLLINQYYNAYPTVNDPVGKLFISLHTYFDYRYHYLEWSNATADTYARAWVQDMVAASQSTGWPVLNTEGGPGRPFGRLTNGTMITCPDMILNGSSGYCKTNFHFIQTITNLLDNQTTPLQTRLNWLWFPMADWSSTRGAGIYGSLSPIGPGWGTQLSYRKAQALSFMIKATPNALTVYPGDSKTVLITVNSTGFSGIANLTISYPIPGPTGSVGNSTLQIRDRGSNTTILTITVPAATPVGTYNLAVTSSIDIYDSRAANVTVYVRDFTLTTDQQNAYILAGKHIDQRVDLQSLGDFSDNLTLSVISSSSVSNVTVTPQRMTLTPGQTASADVSFNSTLAGRYDLLIVAKSGSLSHSATVSIIVEDFKISVSPYVSSVAGANRTFMIQVTSLSDFSGDVSLEASVHPNEPSIQISPWDLVLVPGETLNAEITIGLPSTLRSGNYTIIIDATGQGVSHQANMTVAVLSQSPTPGHPPPFSILGLQPIQIAGLVGIVAGTVALVAFGRSSSRTKRFARPALTRVSAFKVAMRTAFLGQCLTRKFALTTLVFNGGPSPV